MNGRIDHEWAVFWCAILGPLLSRRDEGPPRMRCFRELSRQEFRCPDGKLRRFSARTLRRKYRTIVTEGVLAVERKRRSDLGKCRKQREKAIEEAIRLKCNQPQRSHESINKILKAKNLPTVPRSTMYRHLLLAGATRRLLGEKKEKIRHRWSRDQVNAMWVGDFEHGPKVCVDGQVRATRLSAWIDCHSRYIVDARYYVRENLDALLDSLLRAWGRCGASREIYVDNAKIYHSKALQLACTQLNIDLRHRPVRDPQAGGLIERFFLTVQTQLEAEIRGQDKLVTLDELNQYLQSWLRVAYHQSPNAETKETPQRIYECGVSFKRHVDLKEISGVFARQETRRVDPDFVDVRLDHRFYAVEPALKKRKVVVRFDPFSDMNEIEIFSPQGCYLGVGRLHNRKPRKDRDAGGGQANERKAGTDYLDTLKKLDDAATDREVDGGLDYRSAERRARWSIAVFGRELAKLLGRKGGVSAFSARELEVMEKLLERFPSLNGQVLREAAGRCNRTGTPAIADVLHGIETLMTERRS